MTTGDIEYFKKCFDLGLVKTPFLEIGSAKVQGEAPNLCDLASSYGVARVTGVDLQPGKGVDFAADFACPHDKFSETWNHGEYATVAIFNVLEHTFDPFTILANALRCVAKSGTLLVLTPVVWPIHNYPRDYNRLLPDWYEDFGKLNNLEIERKAFCWISQFGVCQVDHLRDDGQYSLPTAQNMGKKIAPFRYWISRTVHRCFNTFGRSHWFTHTALGAAFGVQ